MATDKGALDVGENENSTSSFPERRRRPSASAEIPTRLATPLDLVEVRGTIRLLGTNTSWSEPPSVFFFMALSMPCIDCAGVFFSSLSWAKISCPRRVRVYLRSESLVTIFSRVSRW